MPKTAELLTNWLNELEKFKFPSYDKLPEMDLYMEQLQTYLDRLLSPLTLSSYDKQLTPAMINNYVKGNVIPAPNGKKYAKEHIGSLLIVNALKSVLSLAEVKEITDTKQAKFNSFYNSFTKKTKDIYNQLSADIKANITANTTTDALTALAYDLALESYARIVIAKRILAYAKHFAEKK